MGIERLQIEDSTDDMGLGNIKMDKDNIAILFAIQISIHQWATIYIGYEIYREWNVILERMTK